MPVSSLTHCGLMSFLFLYMSAASAQNTGNDETFRCPEHPVSQWSQSEHLSTKLTKTGYRVENIHTTPGGCYEVTGKTENNQRIRLQIDPVTLRTLKKDTLP